MKQKKTTFVHSICKKLPRLVQWEIVAPNGLSGGLLIGWSDRVIVKQVIPSNFCFEIEFEYPGSKQVCWGIFFYASVDKKHRKAQMLYLVQQQHKWGLFWFLGGDFNDIRAASEKKGGRLRSASSF